MATRQDEWRMKRGRTEGTGGRIKIETRKFLMVMEFIDGKKQKKDKRDEKKRRLEDEWADEEGKGTRNMRRTQSKATY